MISRLYCLFVFIYPTILPMRWLWLVLSSLFWLCVREPYYFISLFLIKFYLSPIFLTSFLWRIHTNYFPKRYCSNKVTENVHPKLQNFFLEELQTIAKQFCVDVSVHRGLVYETNESPLPQWAEAKRDVEEERRIDRLWPPTSKEETSDRDAMVLTVMFYLESSVGVDWLTR